MAGKANIEAGKAVVRGYFDDSLLGRGLRRAEVTTRRFVRSFGSAGKTVDRQWKPISRTIRDIRHEANKATNALGAMARASAKAGMKGAGAIAKGGGRAASGVGGAMGSAGKWMLGGGAVAAGLGMKKVMDTIGDSAQINKTAKAFGMSAEAASGLFGVFKANGAENARESIESMVTLQGRVKDVLSGTGEESKKLFDGLGVSAQQLAGMKPDEQFFALHEAIMQIEDPTERINKLMLAFGEDGGKTLIGTLSKSTEELRNQAKGLQQTQADLDAATTAQEAMNTASAAMTKVWQGLAGILAPVITQVATAFSNFVARTPELARWILMGGAAFLALGAALAVLGPMIAGAVTFVGALASGVAFLLSPVGIAVVAIGAMAGGLAYVAYESGVLSAAIDWLKATFAPLTDLVKTAFDSIKNSLKAGQYANAAKVLWAALKLAFAEGIEWVQGKWLDFRGFMATVFVGLAAQVETIWTNLTGFIVSAMSKAANTALQLMSGLAKKLGMDDLSATLSMVGNGIEAGGNIAKAGNDAKLPQIEENRRAAEDEIAAETERRKAALAGGSAAAKTEFDAAVAAAAVAATQVAQKTPPPASSGGGGPVPVAARKRDDAVNRSLDIRSSEGLEAVMKAIGGGKDGTEAAVKAGNKITADMARDISAMRKNGTTVAIGKTK